MKKIVKLFGLMTIAAALLISCKPSTDGSEPEKNGGNGGEGGNTDTTKVVFDPATYTGDVGEVVDVDGVKYLKVTVDGYNTTISVDEIDLSGCTKFKTSAYAEKANPDFNLTVKLADAENADISSIPYYAIGTEVKEMEAGKAVKESWNTVSESMKCTVVQPMVQDKVKYEPQSGVVIYIGKIFAE